MRERKPIITHLLVSSLAAAALVGFWIADPLESTADTVSDQDVAEPQDLPPPVAELKVAMVSADTGGVAAVVSANEVPAAEALAEIPVPEVALVEVPDVQKLSIWQARKQLKKQGLSFSFKQGSRRIHHEDFDFYKVRKQSLVAGEQVAKGTKVTMQVREIRYAAGY